MITDLIWLKEGTVKVGERKTRSELFTYYKLKKNFHSWTLTGKRWGREEIGEENGVEKF